MLCTADQRFGLRTLNKTRNWVPRKENFYSSFTIMKNIGVNIFLVCSKYLFRYSIIVKVILYIFIYNTKRRHFEEK